MPISLSTFRAQSNFAGYQVQPSVSVEWDSTLLELVVLSTAVAGSIAPASINTAVTNLTAGAYVQLVASLSAACSSISVYKGSTTPVILATGAAAAEVDKVFLFPGTSGSVLPLSIPAGTRISLKSVTGVISSGFVGINFIG